MESSHRPRQELQPARKAELRITSSRSKQPSQSCIKSLNTSYGLKIVFFPFLKTGFFKTLQLFYLLFLCLFSIVAFNSAQRLQKTRGFGTPSHIAPVLTTSSSSTPPMSLLPPKYKGHLQTVGGKGDQGRSAGKLLPPLPETQQLPTSMVDIGEAGNSWHSLTLGQKAAVRTTKPHLLQCPNLRKLPFMLQWDQMASVVLSNLNYSTFNQSIKVHKAFMYFTQRNTLRIFCSFPCLFKQTFQCFVHPSSGLPLVWHQANLAVKTFRKHSFTHKKNIFVIHRSSPIYTAIVSCCKTYLLCPKNSSYSIWYL